MMKKTLVAGLAALAMAMAPGVASAVPFTGTIGYAGIWNLPDADGFDDESQVAISTSVVLDSTGNLASVISAGDLLDHHTPIVYAPPTLPAGALWTHVSGVEFHLTSMTVVEASDTLLSLTGIGYFIGAGFDQTEATWAYSAQRSGDVIRATYSADSTVPEVNVPEPATLALLGLGLIGAGVARRRSRD